MVVARDAGLHFVMKIVRIFHSGYTSIAEVFLKQFLIRTAV